MRRKTTLAQVAVTAGVSKTTASYVLNGQRQMGAATTAKVLKAAKDLGYRLDSRASGLRRGGVDVVGVMTVENSVALVRGHQSLFWPRFTDAFIQECSANGIVVSFVGEDRAQSLLDSGIDVLLVLGAHADDIFDRLRLPYGMPIMALKPIAGYETVTLRHNPVSIAETVCSHFKEQDAHSVGWLAIEQNHPLLEGWEDALRASSRANGMKFKGYYSDGSKKSLRATIGTALDDGVDAIFAMTGNSRLLQDTIKAAGKSMPNDVLLVSQSEGLVEGEMDPPISCLTLDGAGSALVAVRVLNEVVQGVPHVLEDYPFELIVRKSSKRH